MRDELKKYFKFKKQLDLNYKCRIPGAFQDLVNFRLDVDPSDYIRFLQVFFKGIKNGDKIILPNEDITLNTDPNSLLEFIESWPDEYYDKIAKKYFKGQSKDTIIY